MVGIYRIKNKVNEKCYYGSSKNIEKRWRTHKNQLRKNAHINTYLQNAWCKYGEENFVFEIIEECDESLLKETEQKYLNINPEYNIGLSASGGDNISNNPNKNTIIENIKKGTKTWRDSLSDEEKKERFSKPLDKNPNWQGGKSFIYCKCGKRIGYGHKYCLKCTPKEKENNPFYGRKHTDEFKKKLSELRKGKYNGNQNKTIIVDDVEYNSYGEASKSLNIPLVTIRWRVLSKNPKYKNYQFKGIEKETYSEKEQSERFSIPQKGKQTNFSKPFTIDGIEYRTLKEASDMLGIHQMTIKGRLKSEKFGNYIYKV